MGNYHWYMKQHLEFDPAVRVNALTWDPEHVNDLHVATSDGSYVHYRYTWATSHSRGTTLCDLATVAVIDGGLLYFSLC